MTTATVYDATPAAFALHVASRRDSQALVDQLLALEPDVVMGGGADYFLPASAPGGKRTDGQDVVAAFRARGHAVAKTPGELAAASGPKLLALFSDDDMDFEIDRDPTREPTTAEMATAALKALAQQSPNGFVLLVENENVDTAAHHSDAASLMRALWAFDDAVKVALEFQKRHPDTLVIVTGDHETGSNHPPRRWTNCWPGTSLGGSSTSAASPTYPRARWGAWSRAGPATIGARPDIPPSLCSSEPSGPEPACSRATRTTPTSASICTS